MSNEDNTFIAYEERFARLVGNINAGQYGQYRGRLIRKLNAQQHEEQTEQYQRLGEKFAEAIESGATLSESLTTELRAAEINLVLEQSRYLP